MSSNTPEKPGSKLVRVYDTTLRDGTQGENISLTVRDKLRIAERLDELGVAFIEGGWPGSNPKDAEFFERARDMPWKTATIAAFGATRRASLAPESDPSIQALVESGASVCTLFGKSWNLHVTDVLRTTLEQNLRLIEDTCQYLRSFGRRVLYDAEHFFDGYQADPSYALETLRAAIRGGAEVVVLCDTNGGSLPWIVESVMAMVSKELDHPLGIHAHNDTGCAVANSVAAIRAGARHVQGTINGYGERCGNANLGVVIANSELKMGLSCLPEGRLVELGEICRFVAELTNLSLDEAMPYVGRSAFAHKAGVHVAAMRRSATSYQHVDPTLVGNTMRVLVSELSGRANVLAKAEELGETLQAGDELEALQEIKDAEARGMSYEGAEASVAMMLRRRRDEYRPYFDILDYKVEAGRRLGTDTYAEAMVKLKVGNKVMHTAAEGNGPVSALDTAMRKALEPVYPRVAFIHLADYKVRILDGSYGAHATTRVLVDQRNEHETWSTVGASPNIIEASLHALVDGLEYGLTRMNVDPVTLPASVPPPA